MILEMDMGNTRIKWRLRQNRDVICRGFSDKKDLFEGLSSLMQKYKNEIDDVWVASVLGKEINILVRQWVVGALGLEPMFSVSQVTAAGVKSGYKDPEILGVDRWLSMIAAYQLTNIDCVVVGCGTAMTVDLVTAEGNHLGGYIVPGWRPSLLSLNQNTEMIHLSELDAEALLPGNETRMAVSNGLLAAYVGIVKNAVLQLQAQTGRVKVDIFATGGDAKKLKPWVAEVEIIDELVLDGLIYNQINKG